MTSLEEAIAAVRAEARIEVEKEYEDRIAEMKDTLAAIRNNYERKQKELYRQNSKIQELKATVKWRGDNMEEIREGMKGIIMVARFLEFMKPRFDSWKGSFPDLDGLLDRIGLVLGEEE